MTENMFLDFLLLSSSSMSMSLDCCRNRALNGGSKPFSLGSPSGVLIGSERLLSTSKRPCWIIASSSSRLALSLSSDSAYACQVRGENVHLDGGDQTDFLK
jgi:hypothetical protein